MFPPQTDYNMTNAAGPGTGTNAEPTNQTGDLLFRIPLWMDLSMHLLPAVALIIGNFFHLSFMNPKLISDFFVLEEKFRPPASTIGAPMLAASFGLVYSLWIEHAATINHKFPYPFLNVMSVEQRIVFYIVAVVGALATFRLLNSLHR
jgi:predicted outer membrane lipoprotein